MRGVICDRRDFEKETSQGAVASLVLNGCKMCDVIVFRETLGIVVAL
jgi:hypothetical protein